MQLTQLKEKFIHKFGGADKDIQVFFAPGRVNLIGEHIDYNGGYVFPAALTIGITVLWRSNEKGTITLSSLNATGETQVAIEGNILFDKKDGWANYPKGVFQYLKKEGYTLKGGEMLFYSNLPDGAGLSSSAAIEVVTAYAMLSVTGVPAIDLVWLARLCQQVENEYVGVNCGIMDQFAVANGKKLHAILLDCETLSYEWVPFEMKDYSLVIMNTNKRRELAESKYNERRAECEKVLEILNTKNKYKNLCQASLAEMNELIKDPVLRRRAKHVITENQRVLESVAVLKVGKLVEFGKLLNASHASLQSDYEVTGAELDAIVEAAQKENSCLGARMTGAGFGGCAIALVKKDEIPTFIDHVGTAYTQATGIEPSFYSSSIGDGVHGM